MPDVPKFKNQWFSFVLVSALIFAPAKPWVKYVLGAGGVPCQGVTSPNANREHLEVPRSALMFLFVQVLEMSPGDNPLGPGRFLPKMRVQHG